MSATGGSEDIGSSALAVSSEPLTASIWRGVGMVGAATADDGLFKVADKDTEPDGHSGLLATASSSASFNIPTVVG
jgi:hypothetical protein